MEILDTSVTGSDILSLLGQGVSVASGGNYAEATALFKKVLKSDPNNDTALLWLAWMSNEPAEAVNLLEQIIDRNPRHSVAKVYLKQARAKALELEQAAAFNADLWKRLPSDVKATAKLNPRNVIPYLGEFLLREGFINYEQLQAAVKYHQQAEKNGRRMQIGQILIELGFLTFAQLEIGIKKQRETYFTAVS
jgi:tetratricopeptide (TPR) repeat protein